MIVSYFFHTSIHTLSLTDGFICFIWLFVLDFGAHYVWICYVHTLCGAGCYHACKVCGITRRLLSKTLKRRTLMQQLSPLRLLELPALVLPDMGSAASQYFFLSLPLSCCTLVLALCRWNAGPTSAGKAGLAWNVKYWSHSLSHKSRCRHCLTFSYWTIFNWFE